MKKILTAAALVLSLTACAKASEQAPVVTVTKTVESSTSLPTTITVDPEFVDSLREVRPEITTREAMALGERACQAFDEGLTIKELMGRTLDSNLDMDFMGQIVASSVIYLCPRHRESVEKQLQDML